MVAEVVQRDLFPGLFFVYLWKLCLVSVAELQFEQHRSVFTAAELVLQYHQQICAAGGKSVVHIVERQRAVLAAAHVEVCVFLQIF